MTVNNSLLLHDSKASLYGSGSKMLTFNRKIPVELGIILVSKSTHENAMICHQQFIFTRCNEPIWFTSYIGNTNLSFCADPRVSPYIYSMVTNKNSCCFWVGFNLQYVKAFLISLKHYREISIITVQKVARVSIHQER